MTNRDVLRIRARATMFRLAALAMVALPLVIAACGDDGGGAPGY